MSRSTLKNLGIVLFALIVIMVAVEMSGRDAAVTSGEPLFADLRSRINDVVSVTVERHGQDATTVGRSGGTWTVSSRDDFPAGVGKVREVLLAVADARILEEKTDAAPLRRQVGHIAAV